MEEVKEDYEEVDEVDLDLEEDSALKIHFMDNEEEPSDNDTHLLNTLMMAGRR